MPPTINSFNTQMKPKLPTLFNTALQKKWYHWATIIGVPGQRYQKKVSVGLKMKI